MGLVDDMAGQGTDKRVEKITSTIREVKDWPKPGILFQVSKISSEDVHSNFATQTKWDGTVTTPVLGS